MSAKVPAEMMIWSVADCAAHFQTTPTLFRNRICVAEGFPAPLPRRVFKRRGVGPERELAPTWLAEQVKAWKRPSGSVKRPCALYRHFSAEGVLLYVGVSVSHLRRLADHGLRSQWFSDVATIKIQHYASTALAKAAEKAAIKAEAPLHNRAHRA